ncbi:hypothetical protein DPMN_081523 [Dreissena polymorpha]|uniref:Uncharacterized protein n=1 Tax=Dreissena polymorpha TaxID=45954 RepID=A0A9D3Y962_DREPO|nr:hypothetical protein DPMN_081523 [Dreissena polymorpha]
MSTENQNDHLCIVMKFRRSLQDVRVKRGANVASDNHSFVARLKLKLKKTWTGGRGRQRQRQRYNNATLKDTWKQEDCKVTLSNKFSGPKGCLKKRL